MPKRKLRRSRSQKQAKDRQQQNPKMVEDEQPFEPLQQDQSAEDQDPQSMEEDPLSEKRQDQNLEEDQDPNSMEEDLPSEKLQDQNLEEDQNPNSMEEDLPSQKLQDQNLEEDQNPKSVEDEDQVPKLVLVEEEKLPQDQRHDGDGTDNLENRPREVQAAEEIHDDLENQAEEATVHSEEIHDLENQEKEEATVHLEEIHDLENKTEEATVQPEEIQDDLENQTEEATVHPEVERVDEEELQLLQPQHGQEQEREEKEQQHQQREEDEEAEAEPDGMALFPTLPPPPPAHEITFPDRITDNPHHNAPNVYRRAPKRKKPLNQKQRVALEKKLQAVMEKLQPIPFIPSKILDFSKYEKLLKRLGLWDFAQLEFDREIRKDLLAQLIVNYNPQSRCSHVNDSRVRVNRADLGRALKLPTKKDKINQSEAADSDMEKLPDDCIAFMEDFVSTWFLLHEDTWILPNEIVGWSKLIRDGHPEKVDWPGLIWFMVEKELTQLSQLGSCYYSSHLQFLMKAQHPDLFKERIAEVYNMEEEDAVDIKETNLEDFQGQEMESQEIGSIQGQIKTECEQVKDEDDVMDFQGQEMELQQIKSSQEVETDCEEVKDEDDVMGFQDCKDDEPSLLLMDGRNHVGEHFLQRCNLMGVGDFESGHERKEEVEVEEEEEEMNDLSLKPATLERLSSSELIQAMGTANLFSHPSGELLTSRMGNHISSVGPSQFVNGAKRELDHDDDFNHHSFNDHKRMRSDGPWEEHKASDFDLCMEQVQSWMGKARMMYEAKDQEMMNVHLHQQALLSELQQRNNIIEALHRSKAEEEQKRQMERYRFQQELYVMSNLLNGYKKALKETRRAFSEYKECHPQADEPLYKDVAGTGGLVLSSMELERQQKEREEELKVKRFMYEEQIKDFEQRWFGKFELHLKEVQLLDNKLFDLENETKLLKKSFVKREVSET